MIKFYESKTLDTGSWVRIEWELEEYQDKKSVIPYKIQYI